MILRPSTDTSQPSREKTKLRRATAEQTTHYGEIVQGPVSYCDELVTALITLPRLDRSSKVAFVPGTGELAVHPQQCIKAKAAALELLKQSGYPDAGGDLWLTSNIVVGCGSGSTTADVVATIRAVANSVGLELTPEEIQQWDWEIEKAADPLALIGRNNRTVVYASRIGKIIRWLPKPLPAMRCLGFNTNKGQQIITEELAKSTCYSASEAETFATILEKACHAITNGSVSDLAAAATESARLNQQRVPTRHFEALLKLGATVAADGLSVSHSGTVAAFLFDPLTTDLSQRIKQLTSKIGELGCADIGVFDVC